MSIHLIIKTSLSPIQAGKRTVIICRHKSNSYLCPVILGILGILSVFVWDKKGELQLTYPLSWLIPSLEFSKIKSGSCYQLIYTVLPSIAKLPSQQAICPLIFISLRVWSKASILCSFILVSSWLPNVLLTWFSFLTNPPWLQMFCLF